MKKKIILFLCVSLLLSLLAACDRGNEEAGGTTDAPDVKPTPENPTFAVSALADYKVIYPDGSNSLTLLKEIRSLQAAFEERFGVKPISKSDAVAPSAREIIVGYANRDECAAAFANTPRADDYSVQTVGEKLVLTGWSEETLILAIRAAAERIRSLPADSKSFFDPSMQLIREGSYGMDSFVLGKAPIQSYTVVYEDTDHGKALAEHLRDTVCEKSGYMLPLCAAGDASDTGNAIRVGNTGVALPSDLTNAASADQYYLRMSGDDLFLYGAASPALAKAVLAFENMIKSSNGGDVTLDPDVGAVLSADTSMTAMTFNVLVSYYSDERADRLVAMIEKYAPDTLGVQEASPKWVARLKESLSDEYHYVGYPRDGENGEHCGIFYKKSLFTLVESGTKWLSDTPDVISKYEDSEYHRIFTYAVLRRNADGKQLMLINTHPDHTGEAVRVKQMRVLASFIRERAKDMPILLFGDLNDTCASEPIQTLLSAGLQNAADIALNGDPSPTFKETVIDYFLATEGNFTIYDYTVDTYKYNGDRRDPSDHCPVIIRYDLNS